MAVLLSATVLVGFIGTPLLAVVYAVLLGCAGGVQRIITGVTWAHFYGRQGLGRIQGSGMTVGISSAALGPLPIAALRSYTGSYNLGLVLMAVLPVLGVIAISFARPKPVPGSVQSTSQEPARSTGG